MFCGEKTQEIVVSMVSCSVSMANVPHRLLPGLLLDLHRKEPVLQLREEDINSKIDYNERKLMQTLSSREGLKLSSLPTKSG